ncbi:MAG TPA: SDR family NAD(P)-dependent oxidoreductase, partial [Kofleriaceae bacterium]|nr:SDR family NAD(P)-dependent oxidoreductase [Kofleriaceae bacterium]
MRNALIVHTADGASLADALAAAHPGARTTRVTLEPSPDATSLDRAVRAGGGYDAVYFLGGIAADEPAADDIAALDLAQDRGLFGLFRLVKALDAAPGCHLKIVTSDVCAVRDGDPERPFSAGVHGLGRSIAKEYPWLQVSAIDVSSTALRPGAEQRAAVAAVIAEPGHLRGREIAIRDGRRLIRTMERKALPVAARTPYRDGGVYLVIGGAGGLGHLFSRHLAETHRARLVWVGRRPVDAAIQARIDDVRALGGDVLYLQADAGDATALRAAVATARRQLGPLHGAVHSATVLEDQPIASTDEAAFRAGVRAKIAGSIALQHAVAGEHLDFVVYFGSIASYLNNDGASAYAAGCTFQDRYARFQQTRAGHPVRLIQWGYWGGVGAVAASAAVQDRQFSAIGIGAIGVDDGMEAIRRVLSQPAPQVIAARTTRASATDLLGYELRAAPLSRHPTRFASLFERSLPRIQPGRDAVRGLLRYQFSFDQLERFSEDMLACVLDEMGAFAGLRDRGEAITALGQHLGVAARFDRLFESLLAILEDARYLRLADGRAIAGERRPPTADALRAQMERLRGLPEIEPYVTLLWACYHRYADLLTGRAPATDVLFPGGSMEMMGRLYKGNATADHFNQLVSRSLLAFLEARIPQLRACEKIAILEVGAGTGGTSASVLEALAPHATHLEYFYTDISRAFTTYGEREYGARYPFVTFKPLNLENDLAAQGYAREQFDVVLGANVIHATRNLSSTLDSLKVALKTHGWLILNEMTRVVPFLTITAGLLDGWWLFDDEHVRMKWSPLLSSSMWSQLLRRAGFDRVAPLDHRDGNADWTIQNVIVAESNGVTGATALQVALAQPQAASALAASAASAAGPAPTPAPSAPAPAARPLSRAAVEARIVDCLARTLQIEASTLDPEVPFTTFGVDSIFAVEVAEVISRELGIELRTTALFNHPTARSLAEHIVDSFAPTEAPPPAPVSPAPVPVPPALRSPAPSSATPPRAPGASAATSAIDVAQVLADALAISREQIDPGADLAEIGLDAEHVVRVSTQLAALGVHAPAANLLRSASVGALIAHVEHLGSDAPVASASRAASMPAAAPTT